MGRKQQKDSRTLTIVIILISLLIIDLLLINLCILYKTDKQKKKISKNNNIVTKYKKEIENANNLNNEFTIKIDDLNNIDTKLSDLKKEYFSNIKKLEDNILSGKSNAKIAYLTFDDGPYYLTYKYLKVLEKYNINATFFNIGNGKTSCYDKPGYNCYKLYKEIVNADHTIANH